MKKAVSIAVIGFGFMAILCGQSKEELQKEKQKAFDEIKLARELFDQTVEKHSNSLQTIRILQKGINSRATLINTLTREVDLLNGEIADVELEIQKLTAENKRNREEYARLIYYAYRNHTQYEKLMYILAGSTISQAYQRYKYLKYVTDYRKRKAGEIESSLSQLENKNKELNGLKNDKLALLEEKESEQEKLVGERSQHASMVTQLEKEESRLKAEIEEKERIARELETKIREIIEEEARRMNSRNIYAALTPEQKLVGDDFKNNKGRLPWPVDKGIVTIGFGDHEVPGLRGSSVKNNGIDINSTPGIEVRSVFQGEVTAVLAILGANYAVLIRHGEFLTVYQNLVNIRVKKGDKVLTKEVLGDAYTDGKNNVSSMHFEIYQERNILNPEDWLSK